jgi:hypothetical protein
LRNLREKQVEKRKKLIGKNDFMVTSNNTTVLMKYDILEVLFLKIPKF